MDVAGAVGVHVAGRTEHVAAVGEVNDQICAATCPDAVHAVIVNRFVAGAIKVLAKPKAFDPSEKRGMVRKHVFKRTMLPAGLAHEDAPCFLENLRIDDSRAISEIGETRVSAYRGLDCLTIAFGAEG